jgi:hypothetical protein
MVAGLAAAGVLYVRVGVRTCIMVTGTLWQSKTTAWAHLHAVLEAVVGAAYQCRYGMACKMPRSRVRQQY